VSDIPPDLLTPNPGPLMEQDAPGLPLTGNQWGIFGSNNQPLLTVDSVASIDYSRDYVISDYPQEKGAFQSYNKVKVPFHAKIGFFVSEHRKDFLNAIEAAVASLDFVTVVTPEIQYPSANLTHYGFQREARAGVTLIRVDVWCEEVRIVGGVVPTNAQSTNASTPKQSGQVQSVETTQNPPAATPEAPDASPPTENNVGGGFTTVRSGTSATTIPPGIPNATGGGQSSAVTNVNEYIEPPPLVQ